MNRIYVCLTGAMIFFSISGFLTCVYATVVVPTDFPTIQEALDHAASGETVLVQAGTYFEHVNMNKVKDYDLRGVDRDRTIIDGSGSGVPLTIDIGYRTGSITGLTFQNSNGNGVYLSRGSPFSISDCSIRDNAGNGIQISSVASLTISESIVTNNTGDGFTSNEPAFTGSAEIIDTEISHNGKNGVKCTYETLLIDTCHVAHNTEVGLDNRHDLNLSITVKNSVIEYNSTRAVVFRCLEKSVINMLSNIIQFNESGGRVVYTSADRGEELYYINNYFYKNSFYEEMILFSYPYVGRYDATVVNNTFAENIDTSIADGCIIYMETSPLGYGNAYVANNIFFQNNAYSIHACTGSKTNFTIKNNNFFGNTPAEIWWCSEYDDIELFDLTEPDALDNMSCDPEFTESGDYHLIFTSCCIDRGTLDRAPAEDLDGDPRPVGPAYDIGADEYKTLKVPVNMGTIWLMILLLPVFLSGKLLYST